VTNIILASRLIENDRCNKHNATLTRDGKRCSDASPCPRLLLGGRMPCFHSPPTHKPPFRRKTHTLTRALSVKLELISSAERVGGASRVVQYGERLFPWSVQCSRPGGVLLLPVYWRLRLGVTSEEEETFLHNYLNIALTCNLTNSATCSIFGTMKHLLLCFSCCGVVIKERVHPKCLFVIIYSPLRCSEPVWVSLFGLLNTK